MAIKTLQIKDIQGKVDIGILTIRIDEFEAVLKRFKKRITVTGGKNEYEYSLVKTPNGVEGVVITRIPDKGPGIAQAIARNMIDDVNPNWIFLVGIAGGLPDTEFSLGDVLISSRFVDFSVTASLEGKDIAQFDITGAPMHLQVQKFVAHLPANKDKFKNWNSYKYLSMKKPIEKIPKKLPQPPRKTKFYGSKEWQEKVHESLKVHFLKNKKVPAPKFFIGPTASAGILMKNTGLVKRWKQVARDVTHVEMELGGVYYAARHGGTGDCRIVAIRGISDIIGYKRDPLWTLFACHSPASFTYALIASGRILDFVLPKNDKETTLSKIVSLASMKKIGDEQSTLIETKSSYASSKIVDKSISESKQGIFNPKWPPEIMTAVYTRDYIKTCTVSITFADLEKLGFLVSPEGHIITFNNTKLKIGQNCSVLLRGDVRQYLSEPISTIKEVKQTELFEDDIQKRKRFIGRVVYSNSELTLIKIKAHVTTPYLLPTPELRFEKEKVLTGFRWWVNSNWGPHPGQSVISNAVANSKVKDHIVLDDLESIAQEKILDAMAGAPVLHINSGRIIGMLQNKYALTKNRIFTGKTIMNFLKEAGLEHPKDIPEINFLNVLNDAPKSLCRTYIEREIDDPFRKEILKEYPEYIKIIAIPKAGLSSFLMRFSFENVRYECIPVSLGRLPKNTRDFLQLIIKSLYIHLKQEETILSEDTQVAIQEFHDYLAKRISPITRKPMLVVHINNAEHIVFDSTQQLRNELQTSFEQISGKRTRFEPVRITLSAFVRGEEGYSRFKETATFKEFMLSLFSREQTRELINHLDIYNLHMSDEGHNIIYDWTGGHPSILAYSFEQIKTSWKKDININDFLRNCLINEPGNEIRDLMNFLKKELLRDEVALRTYMRLCELYPKGDRITSSNFNDISKLLHLGIAMRSNYEAKIVSKCFVDLRNMFMIPLETSR